MNVKLTPHAAGLLEEIQANAKEPTEIILELALEALARQRTQSKSSSNETLSLLDLKGLGKEVWQGVDAQDYVDRERASWNG